MSNFHRDPAPHERGERPQAAQLSPLLYAFLASPIIMLVPLGFTVGAPEGTPPVETIVILALWLSAAFLIAETIGYRVAPLSRDLDDAAIRRIGRERFRQRLILRLVAVESAIITAFVITVIVENLTVYAFALILGWPMLAYVSWPGQRAVARMRQHLEAEGTPSHLDQIVLGRECPDTAP